MNDLINKLDTKLLQGRTIDSIRNDTVNYFSIMFTDGSIIEFEVIYVSNGIYGIEQTFHEREDID